MKNPFVYGETVSGEHFCGRVLEIDELVADVRNGAPEWGSGHAKCLLICKKSFKNDRFLVLNIPFWVQNCRSKIFFELLFSLKGPFCGQK